MTKIMPVPRNLILLSYQQRASAAVLLRYFFFFLPASLGLPSMPMGGLPLIAR